MSVDKKPSSRRPHPRELFVAGLTPFELFSSAASQLSEIVEPHEDVSEDGEVFGNAAAEVCLIGLVAHFEAFCKHQFAALINICPDLLRGFSDKRPQTAIPLGQLTQLGTRYDRQIGFIVAENHEFGSGRQINALFGDLLAVSPFSKKEVRQYDRLLNDRHLLVHHAGVFTLRYCRERMPSKRLPNEVFQNSLVISKRDYEAWSRLLTEMAIKLARATVAGLRKLMQKKLVQVRASRELAIDYLLLDIDVSIHQIVA